MGDPTLLPEFLCHILVELFILVNREYAFNTNAIKASNSFFKACSSFVKLKSIRPPSILRLSTLFSDRIRFYLHYKLPGTFLGVNTRSRTTILLIRL